MFHLPVYPVGNKLETQQKSVQLDLSSIGALKMSEICVLSSKVLQVTSMRVNTTLYEY